MHLPGPLRAAVGLVASAAEEAKRLPDRAIELPMLAVSSALQMSLRAQQRYAQLAARGDEVLNRSRPADDPPAWATFDDDPVGGEHLRNAALAQLEGLADPSATSQVFEDLFGVSDPSGIERPDPTGGGNEDGDDGDDDGKNGPADDGTVTSISDAPGRAKATAEGSPATKAGGRTAKKAPAKKTSASKRTSATSSRSTAEAKSVSKPRHTAPSKFDDESGD